MKTIVFVCSLILGFNLQAQTTPEQKAQDQTNQMKTALNLTADQETKVYEINYGIILKNEGIRNSTYTEEVKKEILKSNQQARKAMLKDILSAAQYEKLVSEVTERKEIRKNNKPKAEGKDVKE